MRLTVKQLKELIKEAVAGLPALHPVDAGNDRSKKLAILKCDAELERIFHSPVTSPEKKHQAILRVLGDLYDAGYDTGFDMGRP